MKMTNFWLLVFFIYASPVTSETTRAYMIIFAFIMAGISFVLEIYLSTKDKK